MKPYQWDSRFFGNPDGSGEFFTPQWEDYRKGCNVVANHGGAVNYGNLYWADFEDPLVDSGNGARFRAQNSLTSLFTQYLTGNANTNLQLLCDMKLIRKSPIMTDDALRKSVRF